MLANDLVHPIRNVSAGIKIRDYIAIHADVPWNMVLDALVLNGKKPTDMITVEDVVTMRAKIKYAEADAMILESQK